MGSKHIPSLPLGLSIRAWPTYQDAGVSRGLHVHLYASFVSCGGAAPRKSKGMKKGQMLLGEEIAGSASFVATSWCALLPHSDLFLVYCINALV